MACSVVKIAGQRSESAGEFLDGQIPRNAIAGRPLQSSRGKVCDRIQNVKALLEFFLRDMLSDSAKQLDENEERIVEKGLRELGYI